MNSFRLKNRCLIPAGLILLFLIACKDTTVACFTHSPDAITTSTPVTFNASCSEEASYFTWNFGDGSADTTTGSLSITHQYSNAGTYSVKLNVKRKDGHVPKKSKLESSEQITVQ